jgi:hypothetical protein
MIIAFRGKAGSIATSRLLRPRAVRMTILYCCFGDNGTGLSFPDQGLFVAIRKFRTLNAIAPHLVGELALINGPEPEPLEKNRLIGQGKDPGDSQMIGLGQTGLDQLPANPTALGFLNHGQGADLRQVFPADMQGAYSEHLSGLGIIRFPLDKNLEIPQLVVQGAQGSAKEKPLVGKMLEQGIHSLDIVHSGVTNHNIHSMNPKNAAQNR